jgi:hypothetical protein
MEIFMQNEKLRKEEEVMEVLGTARYEWLKASKQYAKSIHSVLSQHGADFEHIQSLGFSLESISGDSEYDTDFECDDPMLGTSPLYSQLIRLVEISHDCGGVLPEGIFPNSEERTAD